MNSFSEAIPISISELFIEAEKLQNQQTPQRPISKMIDNLPPYKQRAIVRIILEALTLVPPKKTY
jgi:hypothetical protein